MNRDRLRTTASPDGRKVATWRLMGRNCQVLHFLNRSDSSPAYRWPGGERLPGAAPGLVILDGPADLWDARAEFYDHLDLWNAVRHDYWLTVCDMSEIPNPWGAKRFDDRV
jgi:hypothetical protein